MLRILFVEDSERDVALLTRHLLRAGYEVAGDRVETAEQMKAALQNEEWDLVLCDYSMPTFNALSALTILRETQLDLPFIIISGTVGEATAVETMRAGANDYLMKENLVRLGPTIERELHDAENRRARRLAEGALRESEERFRSYFELGLIGMAITSPTKGLIEVNDQMCEILGYEREELLQKTWSEMTYPDDLEADVTQFNRIMAGEIDSYSLDKRWIRKNGELIYATISVKCLRRPDGSVAYFVGLLQDITTRKEAEAALRASEERYRSLFENNPLPMWVYDLETLAFLAVNDAAVLHYGYSREEFLCMTIKDIGPADNVPALMENILRVTKGLDAAGTWIHQKKNGTLISVEVSSHELVFAGRRAELVLANDISERRRIEELQDRRTAQLALRADVNAALAELGAPLPKTLARCTEAVVQHLGAAFARVWTVKKDENELELQASSGMYTHIDGPHPRILVEALKIGRIAEERQPHITNDILNDPQIGDKEWVLQEGMISFAGYPLTVEDRVVGVMAMFARHQLHDDTLHSLGSIADTISQTIERKRAEEALIKSEEQLRQSQKMEAIGQLAGGIAHDFNNLLTAITGYSDLTLRKLQPGDPLIRNIEEIKRAGERASALTRQLLAFSRKQVLQPIVLNLNGVIMGLENMLRRLIGEDVELRTTLDAELGNAKADPGQIEQVILNLVVNARDAMPQGGKLTIETQNAFLEKEYAKEHISVNPGPYVILAVTDTGTGMDEETQRRIFEPFFTTKEVGKGTGLGLSTAYGIVKQSGGNIWVYSEIGHGTTFKIYLPRIGEAAQKYQPAAKSGERVEGTETVLVAEDEEMVRKLAIQVLRLYGYQVLEAANGHDALAICEHHIGPIHILITDVIMPEMSGRELADKLSHLRPQMKVLYMSGYANGAMGHRGVLEEGASFIQKPFAPNALAQKVREVLDRD